MKSRKEKRVGEEEEEKEEEKEKEEIKTHAQHSVCVFNIPTYLVNGHNLSNFDIET